MLKKLIRLIKLIWNSDTYVLYTIKGNNIDKILSDNLMDEVYTYISNDMKTEFINKIGGEQYGQNLEQYDLELFNAYKEADYQIAKSQYLEAELEYYKTVNNPMSGDANKLFSMYQRVQRLKEIYEKFE